LGRLLVNEEKYQEAIQQFSKAADAGDDQSAVYLYALAATYARAGDRSHAFQYFERARVTASARGASQLLRSIERDLKPLGHVQRDSRLAATSFERLLLLPVLGLASESRPSRRSSSI